MTRIYNHTRYPDALLREILNFSARCAKVSGDVPVKVTYSLHLQPRCEASCSWPYRKTLTGKPTTSKDKRTIKCPIGWIELRIPRDAMRYQKLSNAPEVYRNDSLKAAEWFVDAAIHEMAHVAQFRRRHDSTHHGDFYGHVPGQSRRMAHDQRPCEIDAQNVTDAVRERRDRDARRQELVIELAIALEETK